MEKVTFIATIFNEEKTLSRLLDSLLNQTRFPEEVIIIDGGSTDTTSEIFQKYQSLFKEKKITFHFAIKKGNRSVGRNEAIRKATNEIILISDAGCELDKKWIEEMGNSFQDTSVEVVAGYYKGKHTTPFQEALIPFALVMPDRVDPSTFLPATRSMGIKKSVWEKVKGFPEKYSHNEDYVFAHALRDEGVKIVFNRNAIVYWYPRNSLKQAFIMFWRFAYGDAESGILRRKVILLFVRYVLGGIFFLGVLFSLFSPLLLLLCITFYSVWALLKNKRYVSSFESQMWLIIIQYTADFAVLSGTIGGTIKRWDTQKQH